MTEKLSSSNPSWGPCLRKNKTHKKKKKCRKCWLTTRSCCCFPSPVGAIALVSENQISGTVAPSPPGAAADALRSPRRATWKTSGRLVSPWAAAFTSPRPQQRGKAQHCEYQKRGAKKRCTECFSPPPTYRFESRGDSSFYLPRGGVQRRGGGAVSWVILPSACSSRLETSLLPCVA